MNPPAFPAPEYLINKELDQKTILRLDMTRGMSLRDWMAGMALQGIWTHQDLGEILGDKDAIARTAYEQADAMIQQREAQP